MSRNYELRRIFTPIYRQWESKFSLVSRRVFVEAFTYGHYGSRSLETGRVCGRKTSDTVSDKQVTKLNSKRRLR